MVIIIFKIKKNHFFSIMSTTNVDQEYNNWLKPYPNFKSMPHSAKLSLFTKFIKEKQEHHYLRQKQKIF